MRISSFRLEN